MVRKSTVTPEWSVWNGTYTLRKSLRASKSGGRRDTRRWGGNIKKREERENEYIRYTTKRKKCRFRYLSSHGAFFSRKSGFTYTSLRRRRKKGKNEPNNGGKVWSEGLVGCGGGWCRGAVGTVRRGGVGGGGVGGDGGGCMGAGSWRVGELDAGGGGCFGGGRRLVTS